ncbi:MAG: hypothetical protein M0R32_05865 [Candidatus Cloacimonetes bacterium]|nr:hypothetical protein [Candidatus Cloacimonadota bacterium]
MNMKQGKLYEWFPANTYLGKINPSTPTHGEFVQLLSTNSEFGDVAVFEDHDASIFFYPLNMMDNLTEVQ